jgi:hypothetical protein
VANTEKSVVRSGGETDVEGWAMNIRVGLFLLAGGLAILPSRAMAQTCTIGPFTSSTSLASINSQANAAPNGAVICLQRGNTWSTTAAFTLTGSHPDSSRATICGSTGNQCTPPGASANPRFQVTNNNANCVVFNAVSGWNLQNVDCYASTPNFAYDIRKSSSHITIDGGVIDGWWTAFFLDNGSGPYVDDVKMGTCANRVEIRNGPPPAAGQLRAATWGPCTNCAMSFWIHNFTGTNAGGQDHMIDLGQNGSADPYHATNNLTIECSLLQYSGGGEMGTMLKAARGTNLIVRDNTFEATGPGCSGLKALAFDSHGDPAVEGWDGAEVYRNQFKMGKCAAIVEAVGKNVKIYNNVAIGAADDYQRGLVQFWYNAGGPEDLQVSNVAIFNNTVYRIGNSGSGGGYAMISDNPPIGSGRQPGTNLSLYNNLFYNTDAVDAKIWTAQHSGCNGWGTNGANIKNNFVYTPNDSTPQLWSGCSGASGTNAAPYNTNPGLVDPANGNFALATGSILAGKGISAGAPTNGDFTKSARQSPPSIGAYDLGGAGGVIPLEPPVLIQISTTN